MSENRTKQDAFERVQKMRVGSFVRASYEYLVELRSQILEYQQKIDRELALHLEFTHKVEEDRDTFFMVQGYLRRKKILPAESYTVYEDPRGGFCSIPPEHKYSKAVQEMGIDPDEFDRVAGEVLKRMKEDEMFDDGGASEFFRF